MPEYYCISPKLDLFEKKVDFPPISLPLIATNQALGEAHPKYPYKCHEMSIISPTLPETNIAHENPPC